MNKIVVTLEVTYADEFDVTEYYIYSVEEWDAIFALFRKYEADFTERHEIYFGTNELIYLTLQDLATLPTHPLTDEQEVFLEKLGIGKDKLVPFVIENLIIALHDELEPGESFKEFLGDTLRNAWYT